MSIKSLINEVGICKYTIFYWDIIKALRFFIKQKDFTHYLIYTLIQQYIVSSLKKPDFSTIEEQVYDKMYITN